MSTFVSVGNATQPFLRLLDAVAAISRELPQPVFIQYGSANDFSCEGCITRDFIPMEEFENQVASATVLIMHAGAGSVIHAIRAGKIPVVVPRMSSLNEHVDDHQLEFARELATLGKIMLCEQVNMLSDIIVELQSRELDAGYCSKESDLIKEIHKLLHS